MMLRAAALLLALACLSGPGLTRETATPGAAPARAGAPTGNAVPGPAAPAGAGARAGSPPPAGAPAGSAAPAPPGAPAASGGGRPPASVYNIEIIVFRALTALGTPEDWALESGAAGVAGPAAQADTDTSAPPAPSEPSGAFVRTLEPNEFQLNELESRLRASSVYAPIAHIGWSQTAIPWGSHDTLALQRVGLTVPGLSGSVALERGQYLHLALALSYAMEDPPHGLAAAGTVFTLTQTHRVRFYERNYFDNPAFGVIALVTPLTGARRAGR